MGLRRPYPKILIVEGNDDKFSVISLMKHHIGWPENKEDCPVFIDVGYSAEEILKQGYLTAQLKASHINTVGVMLDADTKPSGRFVRIRELCGQLFPDLPAQMPNEGLVARNEDQKRLGIWLMPDNFSEGCLETFLKYLIPNDAEIVWKHATESVSAARNLGAPCRDTHLPKAELYTWLAWQDPPGYSPGMAVTKRVLDAYSPYAASFVKWFRDLYGL